MKILINAASAKSGGAATYIRNMACELAKIGSGDRYIFYVPSSKARMMRVLGSNITIMGTDIRHGSSWQRLLWDQVALRRTIKKEKVDLLLSSSDFGMWFPPCKQILIIRNQLFFSPLYLQRILPYKSQRFKVEFFLRRRLVSISAKSSDVVMIASHSMMRDIKRFISIPDDKIVVNYFGVPLERFTLHNSGVSEKARRDSNKPFQILYVSEYSDYKNLTMLLTSVLILREKGTSNFFIVTTADPNQFPEVEITSRKKDMALASHPSIAPFIMFKGSVPYDEIPILYQQSDLFVFPSLAESFGHPLVEAMASGLPIIASDTPICREICAEAAVYSNPLDAKDFTEKILTLRRNPDLRQQLGEIGRKRAETRFDWKNHVRRMVKIIKHVAAKGGF